ncbi:MAG: aconitate hydratase, partial [Firmicutes bacterium]|nr:aconitate hydratase [Bacillota bacterium]
MTLTYKILKNHLVSGELTPGAEIAIAIDQTLTQDSTGTMAYQQFETTGVKRVRTKKSVAYIDHNTLQTGFENADDHAYITSVALKHGIYVSRAGNGICHQVHLERFGIPGMTLLGSDSHTPTGGGLGMIAIGAGGLDVAVSMGGGAYHLTAPKVVNVRLAGALRNNASAKDVILEVLRRLTVKGGVGKVMEYTGPGAETLSVPERATITNMGAELGATTSVFASDGRTREFLEAEGRGGDYIPLSADPDAVYDETLEIDLGQIVPLAACPHSPDAVIPISELAGKQVDQICIGSCTNSSYFDLERAAMILEGKTVAPGVSLTVSPGSRQVFAMISRSGALTKFIDAGARILECACGPCIGMGQAPKTDAVSLRTFNRNFFARSGTKSAGVYLVSCETAAASAVTGVITDPSGLPALPKIGLPKFEINDGMILSPDGKENIEIVRGPNIKPFPRN